jgi:3-hydroxyacyl-CoA dehydrogenase
MSQFLKLRGGATLLTLHNGPRNTLSLNVRTELMRNLERASAEKATAVILMGSGNNFSCGPDLKEFVRGDNSGPSMKEIISCLDSFEIPLVAGVEGRALGSGFETALACHWRIANKGAMFGFPEAHVGLIPGMTSKTSS